MRITGTLLVLLFSVVVSIGQFTTPGTGVDWTLDDIATNSPATVTIENGDYILHENLIIAENDIFRINNDLTLFINEEVRVTVFGSFFVEAEDVTITALNAEAPYNGFRFEEISEVSIQNALIEYGGGLQVITESFFMNNCTIQYHKSGVATGAAITISRGTPEIKNCRFLFNDNPAISSGANQQVSPYIYNN